MMPATMLLRNPRVLITVNTPRYRGLSSVNYSDDIQIFSSNIQIG